MRKIYAGLVLLVALIFLSVNYLGKEDPISAERIESKIVRTPSSEVTVENSDGLKSSATKPDREFAKTSSNYDLIERLTSTGNAQDAFEAFLIVNRCIQAEEFVKAENVEPIDPKNRKSQVELEHARNTVVQACDSISEQQKRARFENLKKAIDGNVKGSAIEFMNSGPFGDMNALISRPNDPLVIEWKKQAVQQLEKEANLGHSSMFIALMHVYEEGVLLEKNLEMAAIYGIARMEAQRLQGEKDNLMTNKYLSLIQANMSKEKKKEIEAAGIKIAVNCCAKK